MIASSISNQKSAIKNPLWIMVAILLIAAAFRFLAIDSAPPGWRDDELIEFDMDRRIADGWRPLFIAEAEGHEPVYHYLHAGTILLFGDNIIGYKWLPLASGLLTIALTYALARRMFRRVERIVIASEAKQSPLALQKIASSSEDTPRNDGAIRIALLAAALLAVSFWPVMYSRFGVRHIGVLPWMLAAFYLLYPSVPTTALPRFSAEGAQLPRPFRARVRGEGRTLLAGIFLAAAMMTYFAGRAVPLILIGFLLYLLVFHRSVLRQVWWRYLLAIGIAMLVALPMFVEIASTPGGEKRTEVVGGPLIELLQGDVQPAIRTTLGTLGMFTFAGDPEWLYNIENRPVFDWITGFFFYLGVIICLIRLKRIESGFVLAWLVVGIAPAFVSIPAASFSHTIAALPVVYVLAALGVVEITVLIGRWMKRQRDRAAEGQRGGISSSLILSISLSLILVMLGGWLTLRDYFGTWANEYIVRFQYHAPTRDIAKWLELNPQITDVAIGTHVTQLELDPLALELDLKRDDVIARWFSPELALVIPRAGTLVISAMQAPGPSIERRIEQLKGVDILQWVYGLPEGLRAYTVNAPFWQISASSVRVLATFGRSVGWLDGRFESPTIAPGDMAIVKSHWYIVAPILKPLKTFVHVLNSDGQVVAGADRFDVNMASLKQADTVIQFGEITLPNDLAPGEYQIETGLYYPDSGERLLLPNGRGQVYFTQPLEVIAP
jgi:4-amino-4-deoxy-L-arabinose transferase-like glycosyltransferase